MCIRDRIKAVITILIILLIVGVYYFFTTQRRTSVEDTVELTEIQKLITKNLDTNYPATPREVVKYYNRILECFYDDTYTDDELESLADQARKLLDDELLENNPRDQYLSDLKADIEDYHNKSKTIRSSNVCDSNDAVSYTHLDVYKRQYQVIVPSMKSILQCLVCFNMPFTIVKGLFSVVITFLVYKHISPILKGANR